jgi:PAS domain S-box-containing protein
MLSNEATVYPVQEAGKALMSEAPLSSRGLTEEAFVTELSGYSFTPLRSGDSSLHRGTGNGLTPILLLVSEEASRLNQFEHEFSLKSELDAAWAAKPVGLPLQNDRLTLVLEDPGGQPLDQLIGRPLDTMDFLRIAIPLGNAICGMHEQGLIHRDIKPANVLIDLRKGGAWLTGFGIASRLSRERQAPAAPAMMAGTLAYMAPEQTGRMNRSIDFRSDLYALGVTFYEMLTGTLPFTASDPIEWIHCHIARRPIPPNERVVGLSGQLSAIVMKLLAKVPEDRYQTAAGVVADLQRCVAAWKSFEYIEPFPVGTQDVSDRLVMPERLYGRASEIDALLGAFDRVLAHDTKELVLVSGYSGVGKSSVVNELYKVLVPSRGLFATGKFDQYKRDIPYATLAQAFQSLVHPLLGQSEAELGRWRNALIAALGPNGQLIVNLIPELELVVGKQPPVEELPPQESQSRFQMAFRRFLGVFASKNHPLVLFLDDLQWLDTATLDLLEHLVMHSEVRHLLLVGAYRDNEVGPTHPLMRTVEGLRTAGTRVQEIVLVPLGLDDVGQLISDALNCAPERARPLAKLIHEKTNGNPFFAIQFTMALAEEKLLHFDPGAEVWTWNLDSIRAKSFTDNIVDLMVRKLRQLPDNTQSVLKQFACLGNVIEITILTTVCGGSDQQTQASLWGALQTGLVFRIGSRYKFLHDRIQEAAYLLVPERERATEHLRIGRLLLLNPTSEQPNEGIFEVLSQFNRSSELIDSPEERERVARLNLYAGERAMASSAHASALTYLAAGSALLAPDRYEKHYDLAFSLEFRRAESELVTGDLEVAEERLLTLSGYSRNIVDSAAVTRLHAALYTTLDRSDRSVDVCLDFLRRIGVRWSPHPTTEEVQHELELVWQQLGGRSIDALVELPPMRNAESLAIIEVLESCAAPALFTDRLLYCLVVCRMVNLSLQHGNGDGSSFAYILFGMVLGPHFGDYPTGFRFGKLGLELLDRCDQDRIKVRGYTGFASLLNHWTNHLSTSRPILRRTFTLASNIGDLTHACYCSTHLVTNLLVSGVSLGETQREAEIALKFAQKARFGLVIAFIIGQLRLIHTLRGHTPQFPFLNNRHFDESQFEQHLDSDPGLAIAACWYWIRKLQAHYHSNDYAEAVAAASKAERVLWTSWSFVEAADYHFFGALARAALYDAVLPEGRAQHFEELISHRKQLFIWATNCRENFGNRVALVDAEIARIEGRVLDADHLYEQAIREAREHGFVQNEGLVHEVAARFYAGRGLETIAQAYLRNARYCYLRWGAEAKVRQLEQLHPYLRERPMAASAATLGSPPERLDARTVVRASQALSSEIFLERLIEILMRIAIEDAGADRGLLVLPEGEGQRIEAEATADRDGIKVRVCTTDLTPYDLPVSIIQYTVRTLESVILDDALIRNPFSEDDYIQQKRCRSVLCLPLIRQTQLVGVLYLENSLASHVFTEERASLLKLLASQAAISIENARLYANLRRSEAYLAEAQRLSSTGSFGWNVSSGEIFWSEESFRIFGYEKGSSATLDMALERAHPDDRSLVKRTINQASHDGRDFNLEHRLLMPDGSIRNIHVVARAVRDESGRLEFNGALMDVTAARRAEEELRKAQSELTHVTRVTTLGGLTASIAHEVNQPLGAIILNSEAALSLLDSAAPNLVEARAALQSIISDGNRAGEVIESIRATFKNIDQKKTPIDIAELVRDTLGLMIGELRANHVSVQTELDETLPHVNGNRVQLQQVILNLIRNALESMSSSTNGARVLRIRSVIHGPPHGLLLSVEDTGKGIDPKDTDLIFQPFFTTKLQGMGIGLSICRSIIEGHQGRLWASSAIDHGAVFNVLLPTISPTIV